MPKKNALLLHVLQNERPYSGAAEPLARRDTRGEQQEKQQAKLNSVIRDQLGFSPPVRMPPSGLALLTASSALNDPFHSFLFAAPPPPFFFLPRSQERANYEAVSPLYPAVQVLYT